MTHTILDPPSTDQLDIRVTEKLRGVTLDRLDQVADTLTQAEWEHLEDAHLDILGGTLFRGLDVLGVDMDEDPIAVFCRLYLMARDRRLHAGLGVRS